MQHKITIRPAVWKDIWEIYRLSNSPEVRAVSIQNHNIIKDEHESWYRNKLNERDSHIFVISNLDDKFIGTIRLDKSGSNKFTLSIILDQSFRGFGIGPMAISQVVGIMSQKYPNYQIAAFAKEGNLASIKTLRKSGFKLDGKQSFGGKTFIQYLLKVHSPAK
ncbi:hypothetical protein A2356_02170 [Candidatus Nomurabacteria bacterium RIFOXYB1_FULL_39_16]|uniref:N-acetyltransferase domain-containing protein n=1 Tax=Candidatus Nomurabacteria bacterium RIFOXYB1_FULL_39_16 TaxID=1801803 RepID=A0A1F6YTU4_9BACT|nr:MAG: hypothetical protein A2356_02170 [Candidatus Nomurabacteria bacterium RIFOXYB1_FULL_39_16]OGJ13881.1 MAG: hypothetical protein A2585_01715 [Candidatus Nomurabacteria bacterium RIFOXYD1_FULL_39_12]